MLRAFSISALSFLCACPAEPEAPAPKQTPEAPQPALELQLDPEAAPKRPIVPVTVRPPQKVEDHGPPEFVKRGSGVFDEQGKRWFYGVGKAKGIDNMMRAHLLADQAANAELFNQLRLYHQKIMAVRGPEIRTKAETVAKAAVEKAEIVDHWIDHDGDAWHSLRRIDADRYVEELAKALNLSEADREKLGPP